MIHPLDRLNDDFTDGTVTMSGRELPEHLWKHLTDDQEDRFAQHVNDAYTPWDVLDYCTPFGDCSGCGRFGFFEDWVTDMVAYHDDDLEEIFGFRRCAE